MKFDYGFKSSTEGLQKMLKTDNLWLGFLFSDWFEDPDLQQFNGTEETTLFYWN